MISDKQVYKKLFKKVGEFIREASGLKLRRYQMDVARAIAASVNFKKGLTIVVIFPRQSGKNELQAQIETYLLMLYSQSNAEIVKVSPTWKPQTLNAMRRLQRVLEQNMMTWDLWARESGYIYRVETARIFFLSGSPTTSVVGATASTLLECDEAQDVEIAKWDKDFAPMAASTNATRVFWGTMWTSRTLLARELAAAREAEKADGIRRTFVINAEDVAREVPAYGKFVEEQVARLGRNHPMIRTQFFSEMIDQDGGMFPERRLALMLGGHSRRIEAEPGKCYAMLVDVAGEDEKGSSQPSAISYQPEELANPARDSTALTIVEVDLSTLADPVIKAPTYKAVQRLGWVGAKHSTLYSQILSLARTWNVQCLVMDATGVGAGLAGFLDKALPGRVVPFTFNAATKSRLGWDFLSVIETGRFKDWRETDPEREEFITQLKHCQMEIIPGPERRMRWGVPDGTRDAELGYVHDDWIMSAALCAELDKWEWAITGSPVVIKRRDPLAEMDREGF